MIALSHHRTLLPAACQAALPLLILALAALPSARAELSFQIEPRVPVGECFNFWSIKNFTYQDIFDQPLGREAFRRNHPYTRYVNCVRLIGGRGDGKNRWLLRVEADGRQVTDFTGMIRYLRAIQEWGYTPRIVLDNVPTELSEPGRPMHTYGNTYPPIDYDAYHRYLRAVVEAMVQAFGRETVARWRFRVMTEPDLNPGHWAASKEEFLRLYDYAVDAVTHVLPEADIGPGNILNPVKHQKWGLDIIDHCATGKNYRTGQTGTRMRYFSCSWYGAVNEPVSSLTESVRLIRERLGKYPKFRDLPVEVAEFALLHDENKRRYYCGDGTEWSASWLASVAALAWDLNLPQVHQWATTTAIDTAPDAPSFEEARRLMPDGMTVPYTHVLGMLEAMAGGQRLRVQPAGSARATEGADCGIIACRKQNEILLLAFHHQPGRAKGAPVQANLEIGPLVAGEPGSWTLSEWLIDAGHSNFTRALVGDCTAAGLTVVTDKAPSFAANIVETFGLEGVKIWRQNLTRYQDLAALYAVRQNEACPAGPDGRLRLSLTLPSHSVRFLRLQRSAARTGP
jgi:xylan 1,4-beta-xylosidase